MTAGEIAGLIAAAALLLLVGFLAYPLVKLGKVLGETRKLVRGVTDQSVPLLDEVTQTVASTNVQLQRVDAITTNVQAVTTNAAALSSLFAATAGGPLVKLAAFSYGVRRALGERAERDVTRRVKAEMKADRKERKAGRRRRRKGTGS